MRVVSIIAVLAIVAWFANCRTLGAGIFLFLFGCALYGLSEYVFDVASKADIRWR